MSSAGSLPARGAMSMPTYVARQRAAAARSNTARALGRLEQPAVRARRLSRRDGQGHLAAVRPRTPAVRLRHRADDGRADPPTAGRRPARGLDAEEAVEHAVVELRRYAGTLVGHGHARLAVARPRGHAHLAAGRAELDRVLDQVADRVAQA